MIKNILSLCAIFLFAVSISAQDKIDTEAYQNAEKMLSWNTSSLVDRMYVRANWTDDGKFWYKNLVKDGSEYVVYDLITKEKETFDSVDDMPETPEGPKYNRRKESISPDGKKVVFIKDWNLYVGDLSSGAEKQLTTDGIENFGYATDNAGWRKGDGPVVKWSPDSKKVATFQQDQRHVSDMYLVKTTVGEPELQSWKYPLPQDEKVIQIHRVIINVDNGEMVRLKMDPDPRRGTQCDDISCSGEFDDNEWNADGTKLAFVSTSRDHKIAHLKIADAKTGEVRSVHKEVVETQYESGQGTINWEYMPETNEFIWYSEKDNWGHLYLYDLATGKLKNQITSGDFVVTKVEKIDRKNRKIYFEANGREEGVDPYFSHFYVVDFSGKNLKLLTPEVGHHSVSVSPDRQFFIDNYSQPDVPPVSVLRKIDGTLVETLEKADISRLVASGWKAPTPVKVKSEDGKFDLYGLMFTPTHLNENKKYPIVNYIYPGPQGGSVGRRSFSPSRGDHQALAELGFIVVAIDGTCNPGRSKAFHDACYGDMSVNTLPDQVSAMQQLAEKYPYIDLDRVGIWGHSGGGFATAAAMFDYPEFFDVGISESGNHDNRNYEDDWGERYVGLEVGDNYEKQANQLKAGNLQGKLLLAHGGLDDNVPPYNTHLVVDALIKANKDFDLLIFPNARHGFGADTMYMMRKRWDYFVKNLLNQDPPKEYKIVYKRDGRA
ncbi:S9 family peptidase [Portibacter lacus]|uniref:Dipeptidyl peptidase IV n=1 Tax=Portibacter lacus TaxID=1099794 RepID=A0AA37WDD8_9BACT|nr:S9 family peptidase [Portibacter lacus]GLR15822.1 dipeptidyl peptidase IV [Portibacter lacus]